MINLESNDYIGIFHITVKNVKTGYEYEEIVRNRIEDQILNTLIDSLVSSQNVDLEIKYLGIGDDGNTQTTPGQMNNELERVPNSGGPTRTDVGKVESEFIILKNEAVFTIGELGIWVSSSATSTLGTGVLLSRIIWNKVKTSNEQIIIKRIDIIKRG